MSVALGDGDQRLFLYKISRRIDTNLTQIQTKFKQNSDEIHAHICYTGIAIICAIRYSRIISHSSGLSIAKDVVASGQTLGYQGEGNHEAAFNTAVLA